MFDDPVEHVYSLKRNSPCRDSGREGKDRGAIEFQSPTEVTEDNPRPGDLEIPGNYPNPFNASTTIKYELTIDSEIEIVIYNIVGQKITVLSDERQAAGLHAITWNADNLPSGIYYYIITADKTALRGRCTLLK